MLNVIEKLSEDNIKKNTSRRASGRRYNDDFIIQLLKSNE